MTRLPLSRRGFLGAAAGLWIGRFARASRQTATSNKLNAFVHVGGRHGHAVHPQIGDGTGTVTSLSQLHADDLECDWKDAREFAPVSREYGGCRACSAARHSHFTIAAARRAAARRC